CLFASVLFALPACFAHAEDPAPALAAPAIDLAKLYDAVVETVDQRFYDKDLLDQLGWRARAAAARSSVLSALTTDDAVRQINALLSELKTSHTGLFTPDEYEYYIFLDIVGLTELTSRRFWGSGPYYPGIGVFTRQIDGRHFVDGVLEGSPADEVGFRYGDEILTVDRKPYSPIAAFRNKIGTTVELTIRRHADADARSL